MSLQGCGGGASSNYSFPNAINPTPGVSLPSIQIEPAIPLLSLGGSRQLKATGIYSNGAQADLTSQVTWSASSVPNPTSSITINSTGVASGVSIGPSVITAGVGSVLGAFQILGVANGFQASTVGILTVPFGKSAVDAAYLPQSQTMTQGAFSVQEINLDADQFSSALPVPSSIMASIPMPVGFVPNATAANSANNLVAVISYSSPNIQIIDASNLSSDLKNNTVIATFTAPVNQTVTFYGNGTTAPALTCMVCAAIANPTTDLLMLSTAQGYYSLDMVGGTFQALPLTPAALPAPTFTLNPLAIPPYMLSPTLAENSPAALQIVDLTSNAVTSDSSLGLTAPNEVSIDLSTNYAAVSDAGANNQDLLDLTNVQAPISYPFSNLSVCPGQVGGFNMMAMGVGANANTFLIPHTLFFSQTGVSNQSVGSCIGLELWPPQTGDSTIFPGTILYGYLNLPATPDGNQFITAGDPNAIATFSSVVDKNNYGVLVDANNNWIAKVNLANLVNNISSNFGALLPIGAPIQLPDYLLTGFAGDPIVFLPTPASVVTLSQVNINFQNQPVGTSSAQSLVTVANVGKSFVAISGIALQGSNAADFAQSNTCGTGLQPGAKCALYITFTPSAASQASAVLNISDDGGASPQVVVLSGTGT
jgi:hypothetical protein